MYLRDEEERESYEAHMERMWECDREEALISDPFPPADLGDLRSLATLAADTLAQDPPAEPVCLTCLGAGTETIIVGGPDAYGVCDTDEVLCSTCGEPDPEVYDLTDGGQRF